MVKTLNKAHNQICTAYTAVCLKNIYSPLLITHHKFLTRSSAIADRLRDTKCQLKSCQPLNNNTKNCMACNRCMTLKVTWCHQKLRGMIEHTMDGWLGSYSIFSMQTVAIICLKYFKVY